MTISLSPEARDAVVDAVGALAAGGSIVIYTSTFDPLVTIDFDPASTFAGADPGERELTDLPVQGTAVGDGIAARFTVFEDQDGAGDAVFSGNVGLAGSGQPAVISATGITTGDIVSLNSLTLIAPVA